MQRDATRQPREHANAKREQWRPLLLLVDDDDDVRESASLLFSQEGYRVIEACDGGAALDVLDDGVTPDVILTDLRMPVLDGASLIRTLRSRAAFADIPLIAWSATPLDAGQLEGVRVLSKAAHPACLLETVARACRRGVS